MPNTYGRQVVVPLTNKSGAGVIAGDVVIVDSTNNDAFTTTTSANVTATVGVVQETIASNAAGRVLISGYAALINVNASVTRGNYGATFTVAKQATDVGVSRAAGTFVQFFTGGTTPDGVVYPVDLVGASGSPLTTKGDLYGYSTTNARIAVGANGYVLTADSTQTLGVKWAAASGGGGGGSLTVVSVSLSSDFTVASDSAWHNITGLTGASLTAGTWLGFMTIEHDNPSATIGPVFRIWDGTTTYAQAGWTAPQTPGNTSRGVPVLAAVPIVLSGSQTLAGAVFSDTAFTIRKVPNRGGLTTPVGTTIWFVKIA